MGSPAGRVKAILCLAVVVLCIAPVTALAASQSAPSVTITSPEQGLTITSRIVTIEAAFTAPEGVAIELAELTVDGVTVDAHKIDPPAESGTASFTWLARDYADGKHRITVRVIDTGGKAAKATIAVVLKSADSSRGSAVRITSPAVGDTVSGSTAIQVEVDNPALAKYVIFLVDDVLKAISNVRPFSYTWDTTRYLNGVHVLKAQAYSGGEWESVSPPVEVHVDNPSGLTAMREPRQVATPVAPEPVAPPSRAGEATLPPPVHSESPAPTYSEAALPTPELAVPGTAPFVSPSGELITPRSPAPVQVAALPPLAQQALTPPSAPLAPVPAPAMPALAAVLPPAPAAPITDAPSLTPAEALVVALAPAESAASATREPAASPFEIAMLPASEAPAAAEPAPVAAGPELPAAPAPEIPVAPMPAPAPAPVAEYRGLQPADLPDRLKPVPTPDYAPAPVAESLPPAERSADLAEVAPAPVVEAQLVPAPQAPAAPLQIAMLPPKPIEVAPAPKVAAELAATRIAYVARSTMPLARLAAELGVPATEIAKANGLEIASVVRVGRRLAIPSAAISFNGRPVALDAPAVVADGRSIVPFRAVIEEAGGQVSWDSVKHQASATAGGHEIAVIIGSDRAQVDGSAVAMSAAAQIRCDRTVVPLRLLGDALDLALQYQDGIIHIASAH